jgi:hypothetical protein
LIRNRSSPWVETKVGITLAASRCEAVQLALATKVLVITGGPGLLTSGLGKGTGDRAFSTGLHLFDGHGSPPIRRLLVL